MKQNPFDVGSVTFPRAALFASAAYVFVELLWLERQRAGGSIASHGKAGPDIANWLQGEQPAHARSPSRLAQLASAGSALPSRSGKAKASIEPLALYRANLPAQDGLGRFVRGRVTPLPRRVRGVCSAAHACCHSISFITTQSVEDPD